MKILTEKDKETICFLYKKSTIEKIARKFHVSEKRIKNILLENGIEIFVPTKKIIDDGWNYNEELKKRYPPKNGYHYVAIEKNGEKRFNDYLNTSGALTSHLKNNGIEVPSLYKRISFFKKNGYQWYEQWFDIVLVEDNIETKKCPYCNWETIDVDNHSGAFINHLINEHGITKEKYLSEHEDEREYFRLANKTIDLQMETNEEKFVKCAICGKKLSRIDWHHLIKHGITKEEYIKKYSDKTVSKSLHDFGVKRAKETNTKAKKTYTSKAEKEIISFLVSNNIHCEKNRTILNGKEIDIFIPEKNIGIEYDGLRWHSQWMGKKSPYFHNSKTNECLKMGVRLIHIFEDEYQTNKELVINKLCHILEINKDLEKIMGRKCMIKKIGIDTEKDFLNKYHIQGWVGSTIAYGAFFNDEIIAVMSFKIKDKNGKSWELIRFASNYNYICQGIGGKLFNYFVKEHNPSEVISFADRRWTINENHNIYTILGFKNLGHTKPSYSYINTKICKYKRFHKFGFRKERLMKKYGENFGLNINMTETEMAKALGYDRIWDCGLIKYVWKNKLIQY